MNMIEGWRGPTQVDEDGLEWLPVESAMDAPPAAPRWPLAVAVTIGLAALAWTVVAAWLIANTADVVRPLELLGVIGAAAAPLVLAALALFALHQSAAVRRARIARAEGDARAVGDRLDAAAARFAERMSDASHTMTAQADGWVERTSALAERTGALQALLDQALGGMDRRLERLDSAASDARRDLTAVLAGLPRADRQTRDLAGSLRDLGLTAHEGATALDAQLGLLRHRAGEADEVATAAAARLEAHLTRMEEAGRTGSDRLLAAVGQAGEAMDRLTGESDALVDRSAERLSERAGALRGAAEAALGTLESAEEEAAARLSARLDLLDERLRAIAERLADGDERMADQVVALDGRVAAVSAQLDAIGARGGEEMARLGTGLQALGDQADSLAERVGAGDEAMHFAQERAESLLGALDAAARELDETLPTSFARFERSAGEGFERLAGSLPDLERYHALSEATADRLTTAAGQVAFGRREADALGASLEQPLATAAERLAALGERVHALAAVLAEMGDERAPQLTDAVAKLSRDAETLGDRALASVEEAVPAVQTRLIEAVTEPVSRAIDRAAEDRVAQAAAVAADAVVQVEWAAEQLRAELSRIEEVGRGIAERGDSVLTTASRESEASFGRRVALLIESLNSTAIDVAKVLSNDVSDTAWSAYLKGDRGVFTRRAVRLLDAGEAREIARNYDEDGEFRAQVNRFVHDFEALLRSVLADANGSPMAVTLLSSDTGKLYVALAQAIERLRD